MAKMINDNYDYLRTSMRHPAGSLGHCRIRITMAAMAHDVTSTHTHDHNMIHEIHDQRPIQFFSKYDGRVELLSTPRTLSAGCAWQTAPALLG